MRQWAWLAVGLACASGAAQSADYGELRRLSAPPPTQVVALPSDAKAQPLEFMKIVIQPRNGEAWAIAYTSIVVRAEGDTTPAYRMMTWTSGRVQEQTAAYKRVFDEELKKAGFASDGAESLFAETPGSTADLKIGVAIDAVEGRFCIDCPNLFNRNGIPATVIMNANWEVYSSLERKVVFKATTHGGADYKQKVGNSFLPAVYEGFRENVRQLLADPGFRRLATSERSLTPAPSALGGGATPAQASLKLVAAKGAPPVSQASRSVAVIFSNDGSGSGFLVSDEGYLITNQHVVGASKYVKLKWTDGTETVGEVLRGDARRDVALIKADPGGRPALGLRPGPVQQGETVFAIGSPLGEAFQNTMTKGIVSATRTDGGLTYIQSDVMINHGSSGGPLLDDTGKVIGMTVSARFAGAAPVGLNFFIPIDDALRTLALTP
jgi:serine protease Do